MPQAFVSHDGPDARGARAEVWVQTGRSRVMRLDEKEKSVSVTVRGEGLRHDTHGWVGKDDPIYELIKQAHDQGREIEYRIESQRKKAVDRATPIRDLRSSMEVAKENTIQIFAGIDGQRSREAVTHPSEDAVSGRIPATGEPTPTAAPSASVVSVEPSRISTVVTIEVAVRNHLREAGIYDAGLINSESARYTSLVLSGVERVTASRDGETFALVAKVVLDSVERYLPISITDGDDDDKWLNSVVELSTSRFRLISNLNTGTQNNDSAAPSKPAIIETKAPAPIDEPPVVSAAPASASVSNGVEEDEEAELDIFSNRSNSEGARASEETVQQLKNFVAESEIPRENLGMLTNLLEKTFGVRKAGEVSDANLGEFLDHYAALGTEHFVAVLEHVQNTGSLR